MPTTHNKIVYTAKEIENQIYGVEKVYVTIKNQALSFTKRYDDVHKTSIWDGNNVYALEVRIENFIKDARSDRAPAGNTSTISFSQHFAIQFDKMSNFQQDVLLNTVAGNESNDGWEAVEKQFPIVEEEFNEIREAIAERDPTKLRDAIADTLVTTYGLAHRAGFDADADHLAVTESNFSKFDKNDRDAFKTLNKYKAIGVEVRTVMIVLRDHINDRPINETYYVAVSTKDQTDIHGKRYPEGKFLKSIHYKEPQFKPLPDDNLLVSPVVIEQ